MADEEVSAAQPSDPHPVATPAPAAVLAAPAWFDLVALAGVVVVGTVGPIGLLLAIRGSYHTWAALLLGLPVAAVLLLVVRRSLPATAAPRAAHLGATAALVLALGYLAVTAATPAQNLVVTRDPGSYENTARFLSREGTLELDAKGAAFAGIDGLQFSGAAVYDVGPRVDDGDPATVDDTGRLEFQFNHLTSVILAAGFDVGGHRVLFRLPAVGVAVGLLALYAVTMRVTRRPYLSLFAPLLLTAGLPLLNVARNTYSEPWALLLLWGAALVLLDAHARARPSSGVVGGILLGALVCARVDALVYVALLFPLTAASIAFATSGARRRALGLTWLATIAAATAVGAIGIVDLVARSGHYARDLGADLVLLRKGVLASAVVSVAALAVWLLVPKLGRLIERFKEPLAILAAVGVAVGLLLAWLVRPRVQTTLTGTPLSTVKTIQLRDGLRLEPGRTYAEDTLRWMSWYLGAPALVAAVVGLAHSAWTAVRGRANAALVVVLLLGLGAGGLYWWDPSITPDQLWASRRYIPAVLPALAVMATVALGAIPRPARVPERTAHLAVGALALLLLVPPAISTEAIREQRIQAGMLRPFLDACDALPDDAAVVVVGGFAAATMPQSIRAWCGVPVAAQGSAVTPETVDDVAAAVADNGYRLYLLSADATSLIPFQAPGGPAQIVTRGALPKYNATARLESLPDTYEVPTSVFPVPMPFALHLLPVGPDGS